MSWSGKNVTRNLNLFYSYSIFGSLDFARGIFVLFLLGKGFSMGQVGILQTVLFWSNLFFEVPAGILADSTKRKYSVAAGLIFTAVAAITMTHSSSFLIFILLFAVHGMGFAFRSGADSALVFDGLKGAGKEWEGRYVSVSSKARGLANISMVGAIALGGILQKYSWNLLYISFAVCMVIAAVFVLLIQEKKLDARVSGQFEAKKQNIGVIKSIKGFLKTEKGRSILLFILGMGFLEATHAPFFIYIQALFRDYKVDDSAIALIVAGAMSLTSVGYIYVEKLKKFQIEQLVVIISVLTSSLICAFFFHPPLALAILLFAVIDMLPAMLFVYTDNYIHEHIPSEIRASIISLHSFVSSIFISITFLGVGKTLDYYPAATVLATLGVLPLIGAVFLTIYFRKLSCKERQESLEWA